MSSLYSRDFIVTLIIVLIPLCLALNADSYGQRIMTLSGIYAIAAMGYQLILVVWGLYLWHKDVFLV